ncbi:MAG: hypothetical protein HZA30_04945 [Candidatus Omnitrophica bacterium]|nr:hypothetical protein [Candidatus Omnitrophota bacterium]
MKIKKIIMGLFISLIVISVLFAITDRKIQAQAAVSDSEVSKKLDDILKNQKKILEELASIKAELNVIKIRVTR